jgi:uncharacterized membrane protein
MGVERLVAVDVVTRIVIDKPRDIVSAFAGNPENAPLWYVNIKSVEWKSTPSMRGGARIAFVAHFLGRRLTYTYEIVAYDPGERLVMRTADGPFPMETTYEWRSLGATKTEMTLRKRGAPSGFSAIMQPFMAMAMRRANRKDLLYLKTRLEETE